MIITNHGTWILSDEKIEALLFKIIRIFSMNSLYHSNLWSMIYIIQWKVFTTNSVLHSECL